MIRPYTPDDKDTVLAIWRDANALAHPFLHPEKVDMAEIMIRDTFLDMAQTYMAEADGQPVGFIALLGNEVGGLFVLPAYHGRGIGRALMDHAVALKGAVVLSVFAENVSGRRFYDRYGFRATDERIDDLFGHLEIRMEFPAR